MQRREFHRAGLMLLAAGALPWQAAAQTAVPAAMTAKNLRLVVPFPPGGATDALARAMADRLAPVLGIPVYVDNKPGGATIVGTTEVMRAAPDGGTLLLNLAGTFEILPHISKVPYAFSDFVAVTEAARIAPVMVAHPSVPANNARELAELLKKTPSRINYAVQSAGSATHMSGVIFNRLAGSPVPLNVVPYRGSAPALQDLLEGRTNLMMDAPTTALPYVRAGRLKALGIASAGRSALAPDIPTFTEQGFPEVDEAGLGYVGVWAPAATPPAVVAYLNKVLVEVLGSPAMKEKLLQIGFEPGLAPSADGFSKKIAANSRRWESFLKSINFRLE